MTWSLLISELNLEISSLIQTLKCCQCRPSWPSYNQSAAQSDLNMAGAHCQVAPLLLFRPARFLPSFPSFEWRILSPRCQAWVCSRWSDSVAEPRRMNSLKTRTRQLLPLCSNHSIGLSWTRLRSICVTSSASMSLKYEALVMHDSLITSREGQLCNQDSCLSGMNLINHHPRVNGLVIGRLSCFNLIPTVFLG